MRRLLPYFVTAILISLPAQKAWAMEPKARLVEIYCQTMAEANANGRDPRSVDWKRLGQRLEERTTESMMPGDVIEACVREHEQEFDAAEIILAGRESARRAVLRAKDRNPSVPKSPAIDVAGMSVEVKSPSYGMNEKAMEQAARQRAERYHRMWNQFLGSIRRD